MGIGAATVVGSAAIQSNQSQAADIAQQEDQAKKLAQQMKELQDKLIAKKGTQDERIIRKSLRDTEFAFRRATNQSTGLWNDIVSDANGVNFHRFQMAAWTIVLAAIFAIAVMRVLAMFVPIVVLMVLAIGLNGLIGWVEHRVAPWQAEIAGRDN